MSEYDEIATANPGVRLITNLLIEKAQQATRIVELEAENERLRTEIAIAQGTNRALEEHIKGYRIHGHADAP